MTATLALTVLIVLTRFGLLAVVGCFAMNYWISLLRGGFAQNIGGGAFVLVLIAASIGAAAYVAIGRPALTVRARLT
jgi:hypothetical protein